MGDETRHQRSIPAFASADWTAFQAGCRAFQSFYFTCMRIATADA